MSAPSQQPVADRPRMADYGITTDPDGLLPWQHASAYMAVARNYWISTTRPDGRPHATPVWGVWLEDVFYFGAGKGSQKARNLAANPAIVVHLESGDDVVILEGVAARVTELDPILYARIADAYAAKYDGFRPNPPSGDEPMWAMRPHKAFGWREKDFPQSATRWHLLPLEHTS